MPHPSRPPARGEIYWVDFDPSRGSEQAGTRPAVVISPESMNRGMPTVVVAAMTTSVRPGSTIAVHLPAGQPLRRAGSVLAFQVMTLSQDRLERCVGRLSPDQLRQLDQALRRVFGL